MSRRDHLGEIDEFLARRPVAGTALLGGFDSAPIVEAHRIDAARRQQTGETRPAFEAVHDGRSAAISSTI